MRIFAIGDTHLSRARPKPMEIFGPQWTRHDEHIRDNWNAIARDDDILLLAGDISWAMQLEEARADLDFLSTLRGRKLLLKGNLDYWWGSLGRMRSQAPSDIDFLQNDAHCYDGVGVIGARGWLLPSEGEGREGDIRIFEREIERFRLSMAGLRGRSFEFLVAMTHYPPLRSLEAGTQMSDLIETSGASICVYGHLHGHDIVTAPQGLRNGVQYKLVSADGVDFMPWKVWPRD
jgi:predicted phosphohydrolase